MGEPDTTSEDKDIQVKQPENSQQHIPHFNTQELNKHFHFTPLIAVLLGFLALGIIFALLPERLTVGPGWIPLASAILLIGLILLVWIIRHPKRPYMTRILSFILLGIMTLALGGSVILLVTTLPTRTAKEAGLLLREAGLLWVANILLFGLWYWELDGGGPYKRHLAKHQATDFMFPQQADGNTRGWAPLFLDYLFVAFTTATALSPTDTYPLTRQAKLLMMVEAALSLLLTLVLVGRAINIL